MAALYNGMKVLPIYHRKGGVGKTFLASTLAYLLSNGGIDGNSPIKKVLLLDYDAQQDSSKAFLSMIPIPGADEYKAPRHPEANEIDDDNWEGFNTSTDILFDLPVYEYPTAFKNLSILPSEGNVDRVIALGGDKNDLVNSITKYMTSWFNIPELAEEYDIIIIDNPPSKTPVSSGIMGASTHVLIPTEAEYDSVDGAPMLLNRIKQINQTREVPLEVLGIIPNKISSKSQMSQKDKINLQRLYEPKSSTHKHMTKFWIQRRDCYRVMEKPSLDPKHFKYVSNHYAKDEMDKLYNFVTEKLWG